MPQVPPAPRRHDAPPEGERPPDSRPADRRTRSTVLVALAANAAIALAKAAGGIVTGSPALLSEAAHSVADSLNEVFLLAALKRSRRAPDAAHPFGYGKERFFWTLLAAVGIFVTGGCFSFYQGVQALREGGSSAPQGYVVPLLVLGAAFVFEGASLIKALVQVRGQARERGLGAVRYLRREADPSLRTVVAEDSTAVLGVLLALGGVGLHHATGARSWEGWASLGIAVLLVCVAYRLAARSRDHLIGEAADPQLRREVLDFLSVQPEIDAVTALSTMRLGTASTLLAARIDLEAGLDSARVEEASVRIKRAVSDTWPVIDQIFLDITRASAGDRRRARDLRRDLEQACPGNGEAAGTH